MTTAAQIDANRRNSKRSTGPKSDDGKNRVRCNALKHGLTALTIVPFSLQGDPGQLEERTAEWDNDVQPRNVIERNLVCDAARLTLEIERGQLIETQMIAAWQSSYIRELGSRLLSIAGPEEGKVTRRPLGSDNPGQLVAELEASAEGCRWLLERWQEYRNLLALKTRWEMPEMVRFIRLQGKNVLESTYDPALNSLFLAWDVLDPKYARKQWGHVQQVSSSKDPASCERLVWREIADRPSDPDAAWASLVAVVEEHEGRLKGQLAVNEVLEAGGDPVWADRAALEGSPGFERLRRSQSARRRELIRTLAELRKPRKEEFSMRNAECGMGNGEKADDECQMADGCEGERSYELLTEESPGPVVKYDDDRLLDKSMNGKMGTLAHVAAVAPGQPEQCHVTVPSLLESKIPNPKSKIPNPKSKGRC